MLVLLLAPTANDFSAKPTILSTNTLRERERERERERIQWLYRSSVMEFSLQNTPDLSNLKIDAEKSGKERGGKKSSGED
jgi:hypothetical protein